MSSLDVNNLPAIILSLEYYLQTVYYKWIFFSERNISMTKKVSSRYLIIAFTGLLSAPLIASSDCINLKAVKKIL